MSLKQIDLFLQQKGGFYWYLSRRNVKHNVRPFTSECTRPHLFGKIKRSVRANVQVQVSCCSRVYTGQRPVHGDRSGNHKTQISVSASGGAPTLHPARATTHPLLLPPSRYTLAWFQLYIFSSIRMFFADMQVPGRCSLDRLDFWRPLFTRGPEQQRPDSSCRAKGPLSLSPKSVSRKAWVRSYPKADKRLLEYAKLAW